MDQFPTPPSGPSSSFPPPLPPSFPPPAPGFDPSAVAPSAGPSRPAIPTWAAVGAIAIVTLMLHGALIAFGVYSSNSSDGSENRALPASSEGTQSVEALVGASSESEASVPQDTSTSTDESHELSLTGCEVRDTGSAYPYLTGQLTNTTSATTSYRLDISVRQNDQVVAERVHFKDDVQAGRTVMIDVPILDAQDISGDFICDVWVNVLN